MKNFFNIVKVCFQKSKVGLFFLIILSFISSIIELVGFGIIIPLVNISINDTVGTDNFSKFINNSIKYFGYEPELTILLILCITFSIKGILIFLIDVTKVIITTSLKKRIQQEIINAIDSAEFLYHIKKVQVKELTLYPERLTDSLQLLVMFHS